MSTLAVLSFTAESGDEMCETSMRVCPSIRSYSTVYTMFPVFSLVLDKDVKSEVAMLYPELYKDLLKVLDINGGFKQVLE